jgi:beta-lactamase class A
MTYGPQPEGLLNKVMSMSRHNSSLFDSILQEAERFPGFVGVSAKNLNSGETVQLNAEVETAIASTIKVPILVELYRQIDAGRFDPSKRLTLSSEVVAHGSGILRQLTLGQQFSIRDLVVLVASLSDNTATNMLIDLVTIECVNATMIELGFPRTRLLNRLKFELLDGDIRKLALSTPSELMGLMEGLADGRFLSQSSRTAILDAMRIPKDPTLIGRYLPYSLYSTELNMTDNDLRIANKTGGWVGFRADMALIEMPSVRYVLSIVIDGDPDQRFWPENAGSQVAGRISKLIFDAWSTPHS